ncbi:hypothetical protein DMH25_07650 [Streptomyces sp. WAC 01325]|uniref:MAB_1171c family putative transporter n=1 Tax=Streptomyces sp. WAC 01325 TaxID=2203202 RepID=UPI000F86B08C|nr:MAB_1171c family putative transporter [Streptomyces sp. WAC 01325]RSN14809.1 hypothetical protein DMH25_07650 [Streptomyces sp. WAC 01325]
MLLFVCGMKIPAMIRRRHDPLLRAACLLLLSAGCLMIFAAPDSITTLNQFTGIPNLAAPVVYATTTAFSGATLLLIVNWRPAPPGQTQRWSRMCVTAYGCTILALAALFWAGNTPVTQPALFDAYYATTPYIREMIVTYLLAQGLAMAAASALCWRWSKEVHGSLRAGLRILAPAYLIIVCYDALRLTAVAARWTGHNLDFLVDRVTPTLAAPACILGALGFVIPLTGPRIAETARAVHQLWQLAPLWHALQEISTPGAIRAPLPWWRTHPAVLLTARKTALYDSLLALTPYCDPAAREAAYHQARQQGDDEDHAAVTADAAMILIAREQQRTTPGPPPDATHSWIRRPPDLIPLSRSFASPVVRELVHGSSLQKAAHHD